MQRTAEWTFLCRAVASACGPEMDTPQATVPAPPALDCEVLLSLARRHRAVSLLHRAIQAGRVSADTVCCERIRAAALANVARNAFLSRQLTMIWEALSAVGIRALAYKGPLLATQAFADLSVREYDDIDFLVLPHHLLEARDVILAQGFRCVRGLDGREAALAARYGGEFDFINQAGDCHAQVNSELVEPFFAQIPGDGVMTRAEEVECEGTKIRTLAPRDLLLFLCVHGAKHGWSRLAWVADVAGLLNRQGGSLREDVLADARNAHVGRMVRLGLELADELVRYSRGVEREDRKASLSKLAEWVWARMPAGPPPSQGAEVMRFRLAVQDGFPERVRFAWRLLVTPAMADWRICKLPVGLAWLYGVIRPVRLVGRAWRGMAGRHRR